MEGANRIPKAFGQSGRMELCQYFRFTALDGIREHSTSLIETYSTIYSKVRIFPIVSIAYAGFIAPLQG